MFNCPDHPDIASALRTGYPRERRDSFCDEDWEYKNRIEEELIEEASSDEADER